MFLDDQKIPASNLVGFGRPGTLNYKWVFFWPSKHLYMQCGLLAAQKSFSDPRLVAHLSTQNLLMN